MPALAPYDVQMQASQNPFMSPSRTSSLDSKIQALIAKCDDTNAIQYKRLCTQSTWREQPGASLGYHSTRDRLLVRPLSCQPCSLGLLLSNPALGNSPITVE